MSRTTKFLSSPLMQVVASSYPFRVSACAYNQIPWSSCILGSTCSLQLFALLVNRTLLTLCLPSCWLLVPLRSYGPVCSIPPSLSSGFLLTLLPVYAQHIPYLYSVALPPVSRGPEGTLRSYYRGEPRFVSIISQPGVPSDP